MPEKEQTRKDKANSLSWIWGFRRWASQWFFHASGECICPGYRN